MIVLGIASGRDVDLRITRDAYKWRWTDEGEARLTLFIALGGRGLLSVWRFGWQLWIKAARSRLGAVWRRWRR